MQSLEMLVGDQKGERNRRELGQVVEEFRTSLTTCGDDSSATIQPSADQRILQPAQGPQSCATIFKKSDRLQKTFTPRRSPGVARSQGQAESWRKSHVRHFHPEKALLQSDA